MCLSGSCEKEGGGGAKGLLPQAQKLRGYQIELIEESRGRNWNFAPGSTFSLYALYSWQTIIRDVGPWWVFLKESNSYLWKVWRKPQKTEQLDQWTWLHLNIAPPIYQLWEWNYSAANNFSCLHEIVTNDQQVASLKLYQHHSACCKVKYKILQLVNIASIIGVTSVIRI